MTVQKIQGAQLDQPTLDLGSIGGNVGLSTQVTGTLGVTNGGTSQTGVTTGDILYASATDTLSTLAAGTTGQVLLMDAGGVPVWGAIASAALSITSKSAAYTFNGGDANKAFLHPSSDTTARTFTIPANGSVAFGIGTMLTIINQNGAGVITIAINSDTMRLAITGATGSRTLAANGMATAIKLSSTEWIISGAGLS